MKLLVVLLLLAGFSAPTFACRPPPSTTMADVGPACGIPWWVLDGPRGDIDDVPLAPTITVPVARSSDWAPLDVGLVEVTVVDAQGLTVADTFVWERDTYLDVERGVWRPDAPLAPNHRYVMRVVVPPPDAGEHPGCSFPAIDHMLTLRTGDGGPIGSGLSIDALQTRDVCTFTTEPQRRLTGRVRYTLGPGGPDQHLIRISPAFAGSDVMHPQGGRLIIDTVELRDVDEPPSARCVHVELYNFLVARVIASADGCSDVSEHIAAPFDCDSAVEARPDADARAEDRTRAEGDDVVSDVGCGAGDASASGLLVAALVAIRPRRPRRSR